MGFEVIFCSKRVIFLGTGLLIGTTNVCTRNMKKKAIIFSILIQLFFSGVSLAAKRQLTDVRSWTAPDHTRLVFDFSSPIFYKLRRKKTGYIFEVSGAKNKTGKTSFFILDGIIKSVRIKRGKKLRISIYFSNKYKLLKPHIFSLKKSDLKPYRIVIDFPRKIKKKTSFKARAGQKIIVIDPGHGGEDPGAIGRYKHLREKDAVLRISRMIKNEINKIPGYMAILTRNGDYFLPLYKRTRIAEKYKADLFISVHANASRKRHVSGSSVYYLSRRGAINKASAILARSENRSDIAGGIPSSGNSMVNAILLDIAQTDTLEQSRNFGVLLLKNIKNVGIKTERRIKYAAFAVLKSPAIPSVLLETAYITNKYDEKRLLNKYFQKKYARTIAKTVKEYFDGFLKPSIKSKPSFFYHMVKKGENLWRIASRYSVSTDALFSSNNLRSSLVQVGQKLRIPKTKISYRGKRK